MFNSPRTALGHPERFGGYRREACGAIPVAAPSRSASMETATR
jgi:hypothetical protein